MTIWHLYHAKPTYLLLVLDTSSNEVFAGIIIVCVAANVINRCAVNLSRVRTAAIIALFQQRREKDDRMRVQMI